MIRKLSKFQPLNELRRHFVITLARIEHDKLLCASIRIFYFGNQTEIHKKINEISFQ